MARGACEKDLVALVATLGVCARVADAVGRGNALERLLIAGLVDIFQMVMMAIVGCCRLKDCSSNS